MIEWPLTAPVGCIYYSYYDHIPPSRCCGGGGVDDGLVHLLYSTRLLGRVGHFYQLIYQLAYLIDGIHSALTCCRSKTIVFLEKEQFLVLKNPPLLLIPLLHLTSTPIKTHIQHRYLPLHHMYLVQTPSDPRYLQNKAPLPQGLLPHNPKW